MPVPFDDAHVVVFDINVYLDAARVLGPPIEWEEFLRRGKQLSAGQIPTYDRSGKDSVAALFHATTGVFAEPERLSVWTSNHIENGIFLKATQPTDAAHADDRGLGWSEADATTILANLHDELVWACGNGDSVAADIPYGPPQLGREDGLVLRTALEAGEPWDIKYCVTKDRNFRTVGDPDGKVVVLQPHQWVRMVRDSRRAVDPARPPGRHRRV
ncbi:hypothetical protein GS471_16805 [Rhodococcus hoagii]|nr:hypothetical protein [Prescottella equi]MBM4489659.1 hypothetical protein [Prescottella equi]